MSSTSKGSSLARGASMAADLWQKLDQRVKARGGTDEDMHRLATKEGEGILDMVADHLVKVGAVQRNCYAVKTSHPSLQDAIAAGEYDSVNDYITTQNFNIGAGEIVVEAEFVLHHPNRNISSKDELRELDQLGLRPATLQELCAFGEKYPDLQREFPIVALASVCVDPDGCRLVPCLDGWGAGRELDLDCWVGDWDAYFRFLAVRK